MRICRAVGGGLESMIVGILDVASGPTFQAIAGEHQASGETVLLVEDEPVVRSVVVELLEEQGYQTLEAVDGPSGLPHILTIMSGSIAVTDIGLPGMKGESWVIEPAN